MVLAPDQSRVIIGGKFSTINGQPALAMGSVDAVSGASLPWAVNQKMNNAGIGSSITSLTTDGTSIFGTGYAFQTGNFEGTFSADPSSGNVNFVNDCHGDTYDAAPIGKVLYAVSHAHDCRWARSFPQTDQNWAINMRHAFAWSHEPSGSSASARTTTAGTTAASRSPRSCSGGPWSPSAATPARARPPGRSRATATTWCWAVSSRP